MCHEKTGELIKKLRKDKSLTQLQLGKLLRISDKTVSKWERGAGLPDISLLTALSELFGVDLENLLNGSLKPNGSYKGNVSKTVFYVCPVCGNIVISGAAARPVCCGKKLCALKPQKAENGQKLSAVLIENEYFISSDHEMTKEHYISFLAFATGDSIILRKQYPEWNLETRIPNIGHGKLFWYCTNHGLFYQQI